MPQVILYEEASGNEYRVELVGFPRRGDLIDAILDEGKYETNQLDQVWEVTEAVWATPVHATQRPYFWCRVKRKSE